MIKISWWTSSRKFLYIMLFHGHQINQTEWGKLINQFQIMPRSTVETELYHFTHLIITIPPSFMAIPLYRCHSNDLENIPPFLIIGLLYVLTGPSVFAATWHFRIFAASRILHTIAYLTPLPSPSRSLCFAVGFGATLSMAFQVLRLAQF